MPPRRARVAVVFGGRSTSTRSRACQPASVLAAIDREPVRRRARRHHPRGPLGASARRPGDAGHHRRPAARGGRRRRRACSCPQRPDAARAQRSTSPARCPEQLGEVDVVLPLLHGPYGEDGTLQGLLELAERAVRRVRRVRLGGRDGQAHMKSLLARAGLPVGRHAVVTPRAWEPQRDRRGREGVAALGLAGVRQACARRVERRHHQGGRDQQAWTTPSSSARRARPQGRRRGRRSSAGRSSAGCCKAAAVRRRTPASPGRSGRRRPRVLRLRGEVPRRGPVALDVPADLMPRWPTESGPCPPRRSRRWPARGWPGSTSSSRPNGVVRRQRGQHDAGVHADVDVPDDVGRDRPGLPGAGRPAAARRRSAVRPGCAKTAESPT